MAKMEGKILQQLGVVTGICEESGIPETIYNSSEKKAERSVLEKRKRPVNPTYK